ncbi:MAG: phosphoglucosamine mutase [Alphaproteobacteria bacterium]|nr:phosphoglucosamine mutase [Alphaproteobacteria bacterium]
MKFGTDGIRGPAGRAPIDAASALAVGRAAARLARANGGDSVIVARDTRPSGDALACATLAGIASEGLVAIDAGVVPTAALAVALDQGRASAGVMITASHNPWRDNGFKLLSKGGRKLTDEETAQVEAWLAEPAGEADAYGVVEQAHRPLMNRWTDALEARLPERGALAGRRIAVDLAGGAAMVGLAWLLRAVPAEWVVVPGKRINDGVGSEHPEALQEAVRREGCEAGLAVDGDADRCVLVDERGEIVAGDALAWLLARALGVRSLAVTVMSTGALGPALPGVALTFTDVGDKHLQAAMREHGIPLGCEESGHVLFADHPGGDGLLAGLRALAHALPQGPLSEVLAPFEVWPRAKRKVGVAARPPIDSVPALVEASRAGEAALGEGGRVFLRYSGTEPVLRILVEGRDAAVVAAVADRVEQAAGALR